MAFFGQISQPTAGAFGAPAQPQQQNTGFGFQQNMQQPGQQQNEQPTDHFDMEVQTGFQDTVTAIKFSPQTPPYQQVG